MNRKIINRAFAIICSIGIISSHAFAVTYEPNVDESVVVDRISPLEEEQEYTYTLEDVETVLQMYASDAEFSDEELQKYDLDSNGVINANDAAMVCDMVNAE